MRLDGAEDVHLGARPSPRRDPAQSIHETRVRDPAQRGLDTDIDVAPSQVSGDADGTFSGICQSRAPQPARVAASQIREPRLVYLRGERHVLLRPEDGLVAGEVRERRRAPDSGGLAHDDGVRAKRPCDALALEHAMRLRRERQRADRAAVGVVLLPCEPRVLRDVFDRGAHAVDVQNAVKLRTVRKSARWAVAGAGLRLCVVAVGPPVPARRRCHRNKKQSHFILVVTAGSSRPSTGRCTTASRSRSLPM